MRNFNRFGSYLAITFIIVFILAFSGMWLNKADDFILQGLPVGRMAAICFLLVSGILTSLVCYSLSVATFLVFRNRNQAGWRGFFRSLALGLVIVVPLSAAVYYYDWHIRAHITTASATHIIEMKKYGVPQEIGDKYGIDIKRFLSELPGTLPGDVLRSRRDSLKSAYWTEAGKCDRLLSSLPDSLAAEAYRDYRLNELGVAYRYAADPVASPDSLEYIQNVLLYQQATGLMETSRSLWRYTFEEYTRTAAAVCLFLVYLVFAFSGYLLRYRPLKKILGVIAVLVIAIYVFHEIDAYGKIYAGKVREIARDAGKNQKDAYWEIQRQEREKTPAE
ncbi:MAG: hypothetical protein LIP00_08330 [Parabacteroides sp.]|nr:hypothetical protein [Parabacteroides sp.]